MAPGKDYAIRGGAAGRERLRILSRVMHASTTSLFDRFGINNGQLCLDVGCGGGDVTVELARRIGPRGKAVGADIDDIKLELCRQEARQLDIKNVTFLKLDVRELDASSQFDLVYSRFLLTHLSDPAGAVSAFYRSLLPGGIVAVEDIDFSGYFTYPESAAFRRYHELYCELVRRRGADPDIGPRLPILLIEAGFEDVGVSAVQPIGIQGEVKVINPITMQNIADSVLEEGLATQQEIEDVVRDLFTFAADPHTVAGVPRVVQAWGRRPQ